MNIGKQGPAAQRTPDLSTRVPAAGPADEGGQGALLELRDLSVFIGDPGSETQILDKVNLTVQRGETVGVLGESGSGKTMTALSVLRLLPPKARIDGQILYDGKDITQLPETELRKVRGKRISMVFQDPMTALDPVFTVGQQITEAIRTHRTVSKRAARTEAIETLAAVELPDPARIFASYPHQLSGGMRQRAVIAMSLVCRSELLLADEPTTALDITTQAQLLTLLKRINADFGLAIILISHDVGVIAELCTKTVAMYAGQVVEVSETDALLDRPRHPYVSGLIRSIPHSGGRRLPLYSIPGMVPPPHAMPDGCRFHPRCDYAVAACVNTGQVLAAVDAEHPTEHLARCHRTDELVLPTGRENANSKEQEPEVGATPPDGDAIIDVADLRVHFRAAARQTVKAVDGVSLEVRRGELVGIIGESGSGKTTVGRALMGLIPPAGGAVSIAGTQREFDTARRRREQFAQDIQIVFQDPYEALDPRMRVLAAVRESVLGRVRSAAGSAGELAESALKMVELDRSLWNRYPHELSGGQRQRVCIARAIAPRPKIIVMDEAVSALDVSTKASILKMIRRLQRQLDLSILFISHDLGVISNVADRIVVMYLGRVVESGRADDVLRAPAHPYSWALISAQPHPLPARLRPPVQDALVGEIPSPINPPSGCVFRTRCPFAEDICAEQVPVLRGIGDGRTQHAACHFAGELPLGVPAAIGAE